MTDPDQSAHPNSADLRKRAESQIAGEGESAFEASPEEMQKLVHELRTHQIELEIQNEQLRDTQE